MCLDSDRLFPKRAKENIICYKALNISNNGKYHITPYMKTKINKDEKSIIGYRMKSDILEFIFHITYCLIRLIFGHSHLYPFEIGKGFIHTIYEKRYINYYRFPRTDLMYRCIIPKGTLYYEDEYSYASRSIIFIEKVR